MTAASMRLGVTFVNLVSGATLLHAAGEPWRSLDLVGERHQFRLQLSGPHSAEIAGRITQTLPDHEFAVPGLLVADAVVAGIEAHPDGAILTIEALTFDEPVSPGPTPG